MNGDRFWRTVGRCQGYATLNMLPEMDDTVNCGRRGLGHADEGQRHSIQGMAGINNRDRFLG